MLAVTHTVASVAVGATIPQPLASFAVAFALHLLCDNLLHWNIFLHRHRHGYAWVALDVLAAAGAVLGLVPHHLTSPAVLSAVLGGNLPDLVGGAGHLLRLPQTRFDRFHSRIQRETRRPLPGLLSQILVLALSVAAVALS